MSEVPNKVECIVDNFWSSFADVIASRCTDIIWDHDAYTKKLDSHVDVEPDADKEEQSVDVTSDQNEESVDSEKSSDGSKNYAVEASTNSIADDSFALKLKRVFSDLSSKVASKEPDNEIHPNNHDDHLAKESDAEKELSAGVKCGQPKDSDSAKSSGGRDAVDGEASTQPVTDDDFALRLKRVFSSLSSKLVMKEPISLATVYKTKTRVPVKMTSSASRHSKISTRTPSEKRSEPESFLFKVHSLHRWSVSICGRRLKSTLDCDRGCFKASSASNEGTNTIRCEVGGSFYAEDDNIKIAFQNEIRAKEKCLHELATRFPDFDCLKLCDVLEHRRWSMDASVACITRMGPRFHTSSIRWNPDEPDESDMGEKETKALTRQADIRRQVPGNISASEGPARKIGRPIGSYSENSKLKKKDIDSGVPEVKRDEGVTSACGDSSRQRRKAAVAAIRKFSRMDADDDADDVPEKPKLRRPRRRSPVCDRSKAKGPRRVV